MFMANNIFGLVYSVGCKSCFVRLHGGALEEPRVYFFLYHVNQHTSWWLGVVPTFLWSCYEFSQSFFLSFLGLIILLALFKDDSNRAGFYSNLKFSFSGYTSVLGSGKQFTTRHVWKIRITKSIRPTIEEAKDDL